MGFGLNFDLGNFLKLKWSGALSHLLTFSFKLQNILLFKILIERLLLHSLRSIILLVILLTESSPCSQIYLDILDPASSILRRRKKPCLGYIG